MGSKYKRIILKISGEALSGGGNDVFDFDIVNQFARQMKDVVDMGVEVGIVVGGGNIWRGREGTEIERTTADYMGMLATSINALAVQASLEAIEIPTRVQSAIEMRQIAELYIKRRAIRHFEKGRVVIFACGSGNPFFSTDTAAALRAAEMEADVILLAKNIDGVYTADPKIDKDAKKFEKITYLDVINKGLKVMDTTAITLCMDNSIPIIVFKLNDEGGIVKALSGENIGTLVY
jgi:uridylate kinase